jgi:hypothetical protein
MNAAECIGECFDDLRRCQHVIGARGHGDGFGLARDKRDFWRNHDQARKSHGLERARCCADVARMARLDEHESSRCKGVDGLFGGLRRRNGRVQGVNACKKMGKTVMVSPDEVFTAYKAAKRP